MSNPAIFGWLIVGYLVLLGTRYLLGARVYLTCAMREPDCRPAEAQEIDPEELELISLCDRDLTAGRFRHLGFGLVSPIISHYESGSAISVWVNDAIPAYAIVQVRIAPEHQGLANLEVFTEFATGPALLTTNTAYVPAFLPPGLSAEALPNASAGEVLGRHAERASEAEASRAPVATGTLQDTVGVYARKSAALRTVYRQRGWIVPTADLRLDRFSLRGALTLAHYSIRLFGKRPTAAQRPARPALQNAGELRAQADFKAAKRVAEYPQAAPGTPWGLITAIAVTAAVSFVAMTLLWSAFTASVILAVLAFHEAGHVIAMRTFGYRNVHVLFLPLLGALTVGRPTATTSLQRVAVLLAGPVPGLWLAVLLLATGHWAEHVPDVRAAALGLLIINGLNLLPITPFDGGRALESLTKPASIWRPAIHAVSAIGLVAAAYHLGDPVLALLGLAWVVLLPRQVLGWRLRRSVARVVRDPKDRDDVMRKALQCMTDRRYASWRSITRQSTARALARQFSDSVATGSDQVWGVLAYLSGWIPLAGGAFLWWR